MIGQHVVDTRRPLGLRERGVYEAVYKDAVLYQGRYPVASVARVLLDKGLARPRTPSSPPGGDRSPVAGMWAASRCGFRI